MMIRIVQKVNVGPGLMKVWHDSGDLESPIVVSAESNKQAIYEIERLIDEEDEDTKEIEVVDENVVEDVEIVDEDDEEVVIEEAEGEETGSTDWYEDFGFEEKEGRYHCKECGWSTVSEVWVKRHASNHEE